MLVSQADYHLEQAVALAAQRLEWAKREEIAADSMADLERRWRAHLHVAAEIPVGDEEEKRAARAEESCVLLARRALGGVDPQERKDVWRKACDALETGGAHGDGAFLFLSLFPHAAASQRLTQLFEEQATLRGRLLSLWSVQSAEMPMQYVRDVLEDDDAAADGKAAALTYACGREEAGPDIFEPYLADASAEPVVAAAAFKGAFVRGHRDAPAQLLDRLARRTDEPLVRIAALSGDRRLAPLLVEYASQAPQTGLMHLAWFGRQEAVEPLLAALEDPRTAEEGARAWHLLTGQRLPRVPRLRMVGETPSAEGILSPEERAQRIPDAAAARAWWEQERSRWPAEQRHLLGRPASVSNLAAQAMAHAGLAGRTFHDLLQLTLNRPLPVSPDTWVTKRRACYAPLRRSAGSSPEARRA